MQDCNPCQRTIALSHAELSTRVNMDPDALIQLKVYKGDHGLPIGDLHKLTPQSELLLELHEARSQMQEAATTLWA
jgi:hypothetical protein